MSPIKKSKDTSRASPAAAAKVPPTDSPSSAPGDELMTTRQLMDFLQLSRTKIWELVNKDGLPAFKIGGDYRYRRSEVLLWMEKYRVNK